MKTLKQKPVSFYDALEAVLEEAARIDFGYETVNLENSLNCTLAENIFADSDRPLADNSSMDGFCLRSADVAMASQENPVTLPVVSGIDAGNIIESLPPGHCAYIATGATLPDGADTIEKLENVPQDFHSKEATFSNPLAPGNFIRRKGSETRKGQLITTAGSQISPFVIALAASCGLGTVKIKRKPVVGVLTSGDELVMPWEFPKPWQVRNANSQMLCAQITEAGATPIDFGIARDDDQQAMQLFLRAAEQSDILVTSGGISMGRKDPFRNIFSELEIAPIVYGVNMKPGKPFFFGYFKNKPVFALPGNMVSTAVTFELFVRSFIKKASGSPCSRLKLRLRLKNDSRNGSQRDFFERGRIVECNGEMMVEPVEKQDSHMISGLIESDVIYLHPATPEILTAGTSVECYLIRNEQKQ